MIRIDMKQQNFHVKELRKRVVIKVVKADCLLEDKVGELPRVIEVAAGAMRMRVEESAGALALDLYKSKP